MLKVTLVELFIRGIPEGFFIFLLLCAICKCKIEPKRYILSSLLYVAFTYTVRSLPINFGVHSILILMGIVVIAVLLNKIAVLPAIKAALITFLLLYALEAVNVYTMQLIYGDAFIDAMSNGLIKALSSWPSLFLLGIISIVWYRRSAKKQMQNGINSGGNDGSSSQKMGA